MTREWTHDEIVTLMAGLPYIHDWDYDEHAEFLSFGRAYHLQFWNVEIGKFIAAVPDIIQSMQYEIERLQAENEALSNEVEAFEAKYERGEVDYD